MSSKGACRRPQGVPPDRARSPFAAGAAVRAGVLSAALRIRAELRRAAHPPRRARTTIRRRRAAQVISAFVNSGYFDLVADVRSAARVRAAHRSAETCGRCSSFRPGSSAGSRTGQRVPVQVIINGDNSNTAATVMGYALRILQTASAAVFRRSRAARERAPAITVEPRVWYNPELRSALFLVPGLIAYIGMISSVISTALSVVREKERGTMEQVRMAPLGTDRLHRRQDAAVLLHLDVLVDRRSSWRRWCCSACR